MFWEKKTDTMNLTCVKTIKKKVKKEVSFINNATMSGHKNAAGMFDKGMHSSLRAPLTVKRGIFPYMCRNINKDRLDRSSVSEAHYISIFLFKCSKSSKDVQSSRESTKQGLGRRRDNKKRQ